MAGTIEGIEAQLADLEAVPGRLGALADDRRALAKAIHAELVRVVAVYRSMYEPVQRFIDSTSLARDRFGLAVDVALVDRSFETDFRAFISRQRVGSFAGVDEGATRIGLLLKEAQFGDADGALAFAESILDQLQHDHRLSEAPPVRVGTPLRAQKSEGDLYDLLFGFGFLQVRFGLRMGDREFLTATGGEA